jgi:hypothetical protein
MQVRILFDKAAHYFNARWLTFFTILLVLFYLVNCFTPLRLEQDTIRYFALLETLKGTWPFTPGHEVIYPLGYVYFLAAATAIAPQASFVIGVLQLLYLGGSLYFIKKLFPAVNGTRLVFCTLLHFMALKLVITPLSEIQFFFFTTGALFYFDQFQQQQKLKWLLLSASFCAIAVFTRLAGVALVAALIITLVVKNRRQVLPWVRHHIAITTVTSITCLAALIFFCSLYGVRNYLDYFLYVQEDIPQYYSRTIPLHLVDLAEIFLNVPFSRARDLFPWDAGRLFFTLFGLVALIIVTTKLVKNKFMVPAPVAWYLVLYALMLFSWPFADARFWFPVMPLVIALLLQCKSTGRPVWLSLFKLYYMGAGLLMIGYTTYFLFDKRAMAEVRYSGKWKKEYLYHFYKDQPIDSLLDKKVVYILEKYD